MQLGEPLPLLACTGLGYAQAGRVMLADCTFTIHAGERVAILGPNGAGKSTLLRRLAGLWAGPGEVMLRGTAMATLSMEARARLLAYLPQQGSIAWGISVEQVIALGRLPYGGDLLDPKGADKAAIDHAITALELAAWRARPATQLSMGERARVLAARALASEAPVLLADEPVAALDPRHQLIVLDALSAYAAQGRAVLTVMHDLTLAAQWASRILLLDAGRLVFDGTPEEALQPARLNPLFGLATYRLEQHGRTAITFAMDCSADRTMD
jgi:iron complex transport system ATP-binding protein